MYAGAMFHRQYRRDICTTDHLVVAPLHISYIVAIVEMQNVKTNFNSPCSITMYSINFEQINQYFYYYYKPQWYFGLLNIFR